MGFKYFPSPHNAVSTNKLLREILDEAGVSQKIRAITADNVGGMKPAMISLKQDLNNEFDLDLDDDWHICCACHIINRAVVDATQIISEDVNKIRTLIKTI